MAFQKGDYRESANKYLESFEASPSKWAENRWHIFHGYTSILQEEYFDSSESDFQALESVVRNKSEAKLFRVEAAFTAGILHWLAKDREEAAAFYRDAIKLADKTSEKERKRKVIATKVTPIGNGITGLEFKPVGEIIDDVKARVNDNLSDCLTAVLEEVLFRTPHLSRNCVLMEQHCLQPIAKQGSASDLSALH